MGEEEDAVLEVAEVLDEVAEAREEAVVGEGGSRFVACKRNACLFSKLFYIEIRFNTLVKLSIHIISFQCRA